MWGLIATHNLVDLSKKNWEEFIKLKSFIYKKDSFNFANYSNQNLILIYKGSLLSYKNSPKIIFTVLFYLIVNSLRVNEFNIKILEI